LTYAKFIWYYEAKRGFSVPLSGKELAKLFKKRGYEEVKGQGKGSHMKLRMGNKTVIIPNHRELKKGLEQALLKTLKDS
jgi:predicted RNA binding protein YcfA (HicA-like mRNA interferase family)